MNRDGSALSHGSLITHLRHRLVHKTFPVSVSSALAAKVLLSRLTPRQVRIAAAWLDGETQWEIAEHHGVNQATISRELNVVRFVCRVLGLALPPPKRIRAADECQLSEHVYRSL